MVELQEWTVYVRNMLLRLYVNMCASNWVVCIDMIANLYGVELYMLVGNFGGVVVFMMFGCCLGCRPLILQCCLQFGLRNCWWEE